MTINIQSIAQKPWRGHRGRFFRRRQEAGMMLSETVGDQKRFLS